MVVGVDVDLPNKNERVDAKILFATKADLLQ
jgi:hypothetical protein